MRDDVFACFRDCYTERFDLIDARVRRVERARYLIEPHLTGDGSFEGCLEAGSVDQANVGVRERS